MHVENFTQIAGVPKSHKSFRSADIQLVVTAMLVDALFDVCWSTCTTRSDICLYVCAEAEQPMKVHPAGRDARSLWQLARRRTAQLWRQKHGRMLLLAPLLVFLFTVFWSAAAVS